jgi:hypothetical protein
MNKTVIALSIAVIILTAGCVSKEKTVAQETKIKSVIKNTEYHSMKDIPSNIEWVSGVILSDIQINGDYITAFIENNGTKIADVSDIHISFKDSDGNNLKDSIPEYYAGINDWDGAILGWQIQKIQPNTKFKIGIEIPRSAEKVNFN